ncbi:MAG: hypothetical protein HXS48_28240 [Theionarchaea archaeon]|nr:hypothetical protein [Theionarchaea archaeon]
MNDETSRESYLDAKLAIAIGVLTIVGLPAITREFSGSILFSWLGLPKEATVPSYILLYSLLGGLAYLLNSTIGQYEKLKKNESFREIERELAEKEVEKRMLEREHKKEADLEEAGEVKKRMLKWKLDLEEVKESLVNLEWRRSKTIEVWKKVELKFWVKLSRIPFGMAMAAAFYLLVTFLVPEGVAGSSGSITENTRLLAGIAFVVALFPRVMMESLGGLADRLMGKGISPNETLVVSEQSSSGNENNPSKSLVVNEQSSASPQK